MIERTSRHALIGAALAGVASLAVASDLGYIEPLGLRDGSADVELLDSSPVLRGDLGEIVVTSTRTHAGR